MGIVVPFRPRAAAPQATVQAHAEALRRAAEEAVLTAARDGASRYEVLDAAADLLALCRDRYGFTVMQHGLPREPDALADSLVSLLRGLAELELECAGGRPFPGFGVYFGRSTLEWFEDGCGGRTGLAVPATVNSAELAAFVRPRLQLVQR